MSRPAKQISLGNQNERSRARVSDLVWGAKWGLRLASLYCVWIIILIGLNRSLTLKASGGHTVNALAVLALYVLGGAIAGAVVGITRPLQRSMIGAMLSGWFAALPVFWGAVFVVRGFVPWDSESTIIVVAGSLMLGPTLGAYVKAFNDEEKSQKHKGSEI